MDLLVIPHYIQYVLWGAVVVLHLAALLDCSLRRADAFPAAGKMTKQGWLLIIVLALVVTLLFGALGLLGLVGVIASLVYFLDVRPAVREATEGGHW